MKTIGLIGGMSWESTVTYYEIINDAVKQALGGLHSAKIVLYSVDFAEIEAYQASGDWDTSAQILAQAAQKLERAGADFILICTNTMHKVAPHVQANINIPLLHIADATARQLVAGDIKKVALLGTKYTMTQDFYVNRIQAHGIEVLVPQGEEIELVNHVIYDELCRGETKDASRGQFIHIIERLQRRGAQAVILGCTEIGLLVKQQDSPLPVFDTAQIHARAAAQAAIQGDEVLH